jgi:hypothetical protein
MLGEKIAGATGGDNSYTPGHSLKPKVKEAWQNSDLYKQSRSYGDPQARPAPVANQLKGVSGSRKVDPSGGAARPQTIADQDARNAAIANFTPPKNRSKSTKPPDQRGKVLTADKVDITQPDQRAAFNQQEMERARRRAKDPDVTPEERKAAAADALKWEAEAKKSRLAAVKAEQKRVVTSQQELFGVDVGSSLPLFSMDSAHATSYRIDRLLKGGKFSAKKQTPGTRKVNCSPKSQECGSSCIPKSYNCNKGDLASASNHLKREGSDDLQIQKAKNFIKAKAQPRREELAKAQAARARANQGSAPGISSTGLATLDPKTIKVDPKRFQYKLIGEHTASGEVGSLSGVQKWDPNLGGVLQVWKDPADGGTYVVNGHNRLALAKRAGAQAVDARFLNVPNAKAARSVGLVAVPLV